MASFSDFIVDDSGYQRPVVGADVYLLNADGSLSPATSPNPTLTDGFGAYTFTAPDNVYTVEARQGGVMIARGTVTIGNPPQYVGPAGPADNTYTTYAALLASDPTRKSARLVPQAGETEPAGNFSYVDGQWVRQAADGIVYSPALIPAPSRSLNRVNDDRPLITDLGARVGGFDNSAVFAEIAAKAKELGLATATPPRIQIPSGIFDFSASPNWAAQGFHIDAQPGAVLRHTGSGRAFIVDGGANGGGIGLMKVTGGLVIRGNPNTTDGMYNRAVHHSTFDVEVQNVSIAGLRTEWVVCNEYWFRCSPVYRPSFNPIPTVGMFLTSRNPGEKTSRCTFHNPILEGINGYGINFDDVVASTLLGGTSESNVAGLYISINSVGNDILGLDLEFNTVADIFCQGLYNNIQPKVSDSTSTISGLLNKVSGGLWNEILNTGDHNDFECINFGIAGGGFKDNGTNTTYQNMRAANNATFLADRIRRPVAERYLTDFQGNGLFEGAGDLSAMDGRAIDTWRYKYGSGRAIFAGSEGMRFAHSNAGVSFFGKPDVPQRTYPAAGTDAATTQALTNAIAQHLIDLGLAVRSAS